MGKKKREHVVFDQMLKPKKNIPFSKINKTVVQKQKKDDVFKQKMGSMS